MTGIGDDAVCVIVSTPGSNPLSEIGHQRFDVDVGLR